MPFFMFALLFLTGCDFSQQIQDTHLHDRVIACAAGFSNEVQTDLHALYHSTNGLSAGFKAHAKAAIFDALPPQDRIKAYEDYIRCIEYNERCRKIYPFHK